MVAVIVIIAMSIEAAEVPFVALSLRGLKWVVQNHKSESKGIPDFRIPEAFAIHQLLHKQHHCPMT